MATFERSRLTRDVDSGLAELYRELLVARRELPAGDVDEATFDEEARWLRVRRAEFELVCNFAAVWLRLACSASAIRVATSPEVRLEAEAGRKNEQRVRFFGQAQSEVHLPPLSGALLR